MEVLLDNHWNSYLLQFDIAQYDIYFKEEYVYLYESETEKPFCIIVCDSDKYMLFPFLRRQFDFRGETYFDFETAYGYGGPIFNSEDINFRTNALQMLYSTFAEKGYVAGFVRFHPLFNNYIGFDDIGKVIMDRKTIAMDLSLSEDEIWMKEIHTKNRNVIKKGSKNGLEFIVDDAFIYQEQFIKLYNSTMDKLSAEGFYYFDSRYYDNLNRNIPNSFLGVVKHGNDILSAAIFMYHGPYSHYHLSGSNKEFLNMLPNNFMLYNAALELKKRGAKLFHLGGGTTSSSDDSLFCFKSRFSKNLFQFAIGKMIFLPTVYQSVCDCWEQCNPGKVDQYKYYLLKYKY